MKISNKLKLVAISAALSVAQVISPSAAATAGETDNGDFCAVVAEFARNAMIGRQNGAKLSDLINHLKNSDSEANSEAAFNMAKEIAIQAFEQPRYTTKSVQQKAITDFENTYYLACLKALSK